MSARAKSRSEQHLIDAAGERLLRARLPEHWVLREYRPDYGLDFSLEVFKRPHSSAPGIYETLGEHIFIQLKTVSTAQTRSLPLYGRFNVEKQREVLDKADLVGRIEVVPFSLERSELVTVERMGVGVPVLLVVADLSTSRCFFVCLNDYIDKILVPRYADYQSTGSRTVHVPILNEVGAQGPGQAAFRWYSKRPKLYSAFQRFVFQAAELQFEGEQSGSQMADYFASRIASYDFWNDTEMWGPLSGYGSMLRKFIATGQAELLKDDEAKTLDGAAHGDPEGANEKLAHVRWAQALELWRRLAVLPRYYEDVCREWYLPTALGYYSSFAGKSADSDLKDGKASEAQP